MSLVSKLAACLAVRAGGLPPRTYGPQRAMLAAEPRRYGLLRLSQAKLGDTSCALQPQKVGKKLFQVFTFSDGGAAMLPSVGPGVMEAG